MSQTRATPCSSRFKMAASSARFAAAFTCSRTAPLISMSTISARPRRCKGAASRQKMMKAMLAWGEAQGCTYAWVATETDNEQAKGFYAAQAFEPGTIAMFSTELD